MNGKRHVWLLNGGDSFSTREQFIKHLSFGRALRTPPGLLPEKSWKDSLESNLGSDYLVIFPKLPNRENAHYEEWKAWFERYLDYLEPEAIFIGHSLGGMFLAKYLAENTLALKLSQVILLAAPSGEWPRQMDGNDLESFKFSASDASKIMKNASQLEVWHSKDDLIVPVVESEWYQKHVPGVKIRHFSDKNHFNLVDFPDLVEVIKSVPYLHPQPIPS